MSDLRAENVWAIESPDPFLLDKFPTDQLRKYNDVWFLLSKKALTCLPQTSHGSACVVSFTHQDSLYFLLVTDNKPFVQNVCGTAIENESPQQCMVRELQEEISTTFDVGELVPIGHWTFANRVTLVNDIIETTTHAYYVHVAFDRIAHLLTGAFSASEPTMFVCTNEEIQSVVVVPAVCLDVSYPPEHLATLFGKTFQGHHREIMLRILNQPPKFDVSYLHEFVIDIPPRVFN